MSRFGSVCLGRVVSTRAARSSQPGSTSLGKRDVAARLNQLRKGGRRGPAQPASGGDVAVRVGLFGEGGFDSGRSFLAARLNQLGKEGRRSPAQPASGGDVAARLNRLWEGTRNKEPGRGSAALRWLRRGGWASQERPCRVRSHMGRRPIDLTSSASDFSSSTETLTRLLAKALSGRPWTISHSLSQQRTGNDETRPAGTP